MARTARACPPKLDVDLSAYSLRQRPHPCFNESLRMTFILFSLGVAAAFFVSSLVLLNLGRRLGLRYLRQEGSSMTGLTTVEGAVFALIGRLLAFTISGGLQRFDERRQLVIQEANAVTAASDRLNL